MAIPYFDYKTDPETGKSYRWWTHSLVRDQGNTGDAWSHGGQNMAVIEKVLMNNERLLNEAKAAWRVMMAPDLPRLVANRITHIKQGDRLLDVMTTMCVSYKGLPPRYPIEYIIRRAMAIQILWGKPEADRFIASGGRADPDVIVRPDVVMTSFLHARELQ